MKSTTLSKTHTQPPSPKNEQDYGDKGTGPLSLSEGEGFLHKSRKPSFLVDKGVNGGTMNLSLCPPHHRTTTTREREVFCVSRKPPVLSSHFFLNKHANLNFTFPSPEEFPILS